MLQDRQTARIIIHHPTLDFARQSESFTTQHRWHASENLKDLQLADDSIDTLHSFASSFVKNSFKLSLRRFASLKGWA